MLEAGAAIRDAAATGLAELITSPLPVVWPATLARHDLCWLKQDAADFSASLIPGTLDLHPIHTPEQATLARETILGWVAQRRPFVMTRQDPSQRPTHRTLALCRPREYSPRRITLEVPFSVVELVVLPVSLEQAIRSAPENFQSALAAIETTLVDMDLTARVFGSLAWQTITHLPYLHAASDVDLIIDLDGNAWCRAITPDGHLTTAFAALGTCFDAVPFRCDCELRLNRDGACSLAELRGNSRQVLVKRNTRNAIVPRQELRASLT